MVVDINSVNLGAVVGVSGHFIVNTVISVTTASASWPLRSGGRADAFAAAAAFLLGLKMKILTVLTQMLCVVVTLQMRQIRRKTHDFIV